MSVFEGIKAFRHKDSTTIKIFRPQENAKRINHSAEMVSMPEIPEDLFLEALRRAVAGNLEFVPPYKPNAAGGALYIRPLYFGSGANLILAPPDGDSRSPHHTKDELTHALHYRIHLHRLRHARRQLVQHLDRFRQSDRHRRRHRRDL